MLTCMTEVQLIYVFARLQAQKGREGYEIISALGKTRTSVSVYFYLLVQSLRVKLVYIWVRVFCTGLARDTGQALPKDQFIMKKKISENM